MTTKFGFSKMTIQEFETWIASLHLGRTILTVQQHHTLIPSYADFNGSNHFEMQQSMKNYHVNSNGWSNIGQHFSSFPDGTIVTGRPLEQTPACILGQNSHAICIEHVGNFDQGKNTMTAAQCDTAVRMTAALCKKFNLTVNTTSIVYHHWFDLSTGERNNGTKNNKSCPGTNFFGGNKVADCTANFLPLVAHLVTPGVAAQEPGIAVTPSATVLKYVSVTSSSLNVRSKPDPTSAKADRPPLAFGAVLRVFKEDNGWYKISGSQEHWVSAKFTTLVKRALVTADALNVRSGPDKSFEKVGTYAKGQELFIESEQNNWGKVNFEPKWVNNGFLSY